MVAFGAFLLSTGLVLLWSGLHPFKAYHHTGYYLLKARLALKEARQGEEPPKYTWEYKKLEYVRGELSYRELCEWATFYATRGELISWEEERKRLRKEGALV